MSALDELTLNVIVAAQAQNDAMAETAAQQLCDWLRMHPDDTARVDLGILETLKHARMIGPLHSLAETLNGLGHTAPKVRLALGQALIDGGQPSTAVDVLRKLAGGKLQSAERTQVEGLMGRAFKDLFHRIGFGNDRSVQLLNLAIKHYANGFRASDDSDNWTGENLIALLALARRRGLPTNTDLDELAIAARVERAIGNAPKYYWHWASLAVVHASRGDWTKASDALKNGLQAEGATAFALNGTVRQLRDIWEVDDLSTQAAGLIATLQAHLLRMTQGHLQMSPTEMRLSRAAIEMPEQHFEKILGPYGAQTRAWMERLLKVGESVGLVSKRLDLGIGTCFVVKGEDFHASLVGERLILTNDHVISPAPEKYQSAPPLPVEKAEVSFEVLSKSRGECRMNARNIVWSSGSQDHDACLVRLEGELPEALAPLTLVDHIPSVDPDAPEGIFIVGHPGGRTLSYSIQNNELLDHDCKGVTTDPRRIHYFTPTEPGSSGSPAMNSDLDVIGLHHAGAKYMSRLNGQEGTYPANEAMWIRSIRLAARSDLEAGRSRFT
ncbi:MAG: serine protease [Paracoccaceae bacterium]|jgi:hypothetical protein